MLNEVKLHGHVGADPKDKATTTGNKFARFSFATTETWKDKATGEKRSKTEWHQIVAWGSWADRVLKNVKKGQELLVTGKIEYIADKEHPGVTYCNIKLSNFEFCGKKKDSANRSEMPEPDPGRDEIPDPPEPVLVDDEPF